MTESDITVLQKSVLFSRCSSNDIRQILKNLNATIKDYKKGVTIYASGSKVNSLGVVISGSVYIQQSDWQGNLNILHEIKSGDIFAEAFAVKDDILLTNDVVASVDSRILFIEVKWVLASDAIEDKLKVRFIQNLYRISSARNLYLTKKVRYLSCRSTRDKLIAYLSEQARMEASNSFDIPFDRQQLADYLSVERSALSAELSKMQSAGLLKFKKNHFTLFCSE